MFSNIFIYFKIFQSLKFSFEVESRILQVGATFSKFSHPQDGSFERMNFERQDFQQPDFEWPDLGTTEL
jgi:hypothetical protein